MGMGGRIQAGWCAPHYRCCTALTNLLPTVAADLFCYMDDEVDVWAASLPRAAAVFAHSDE